MSSSDYESALVTELQALAGVPAGTDAFALRFGGQTTAVVYSQFSSSPSTLTLEARYDDVPGLPAGRPIVATRPLDIVLRPEGGPDRAAKAQGINVEWQTGDRAFDDTVYVSTPTESGEVLRAVLGPEVRSAVMTLFGLGFRMVRIDDDGVVRAEVTEFVVAVPQAGRGRSAMEAFVRILTNLPAVVASGAKHAAIPLAETTRALAWTAAGFGLVFVVAAFGALVAPKNMASRNTLGFLVLCVGPWVALALASPAFLLARKIHGGRVARAMRGRSRTAKTADLAGWAAGLCVLFIVADLIHAASLFMFVLRR
jgi:hypothetical protein